MRSYLQLAELAQAAREVLDARTWGYYASGADDEITLAHNASAWRDLRLRPRMFAGVGTPELGTTVLGQRVDLPVLVAPMAFQGLAHPDAEVGMLRAAGRHGTVMCLSTLSNTPVEQATAVGPPVWFQLYVVRDRGLTRALVERVEAAGCRALVVTVDTPVLGRRLADSRSGFVLPPDLPLPNLPVHAEVLAQSVDAGSALAHFASTVLDPALTWADLEALAGSTSLPIIAKGVLRADDARRAVDHGARAVIVSNHGGRQLDTTVPTAWVLPEVVEAVGDRAEVYVDGGIRSGTDVLKALALGARAVLVGRPLLWGLAAHGEAGAAVVLQMLREELERAMALSGCGSVEVCTRDLVWPGA
jgi:4-hydroxymandelate oxidase